MTARGQRSASASPVLTGPRTTSLSRLLNLLQAASTLTVESQVCVCELRVAADQESGTRARERDTERGRERERRNRKVQVTVPRPPASPPNVFFSFFFLCSLYPNVLARTCWTRSGTSLLGVPIFWHVCLTNTPFVCSSAPTVSRRRPGRDCSLG